MIDYSCNHTSRESNGPMLGVKIQTFRPNPGPPSVNNDLEYKTSRWHPGRTSGGSPPHLVKERCVPPVKCLPIVSHVLPLLLAPQGPL